MAGRNIELAGGQPLLSSNGDCMKTAGAGAYKNLYLPKEVDGVHVLEVGNTWRLSGQAKKAFQPICPEGMAYRLEKNQAKLSSKYTLGWDASVPGFDEGDGWVRVPSLNAMGALEDLYLPKQMNGTLVLELGSVFAWQLSSDAKQAFRSYAPEGMAFRTEKDIAKESRYTFRWNTSVSGFDEGDGWVRVPWASAAAHLMPRDQAPVQQSMDMSGRQMLPRGEAPQVPIFKNHAKSAAVLQGIKSALPEYDIELVSGAKLELDKGSDCHDCCCGSCIAGDEDCCCCKQSFYQFSVEFHPGCALVVHAPLGSKSRYGHSKFKENILEEQERVWRIISAVVGKHGFMTPLPDFAELRRIAMEDEMGHSQSSASLCVCCVMLTCLAEFLK